MKTRVLFCGLPLMMASLCFVACNDEGMGNIPNEDNTGNTDTDNGKVLVPMTFNAVGSSCSRTELQPE